MARLFPLSELTFAPHILLGFLGNQTTEPSVVQTLGTRHQLPYGDSVAYSVRNHDAQYVGPGQPKAGSALEALETQYHTHWFQKTVRLPERDIEMYRSYGQPFIEEMVADMIAAMPRALDYAVIHGIDPRTGEAVTALAPAIHDSTLVLDGSGQPAYAGIDAAKRALFANGYRPNGVALATGYAADFATARAGLNEQLIYPTFDPNGISTLEGLRTVVSETVAAQGKEKAPKPFEPLQAIVGDWRTVVWDIVRPATLVEFTSGDPDNTGRDLAGYNEVAYRLEVAFAWGVADPNAFALVTGTPAQFGVGVSLPNALVAVEADKVDVDAGTVNVGEAGGKRVSPFDVTGEPGDQPVGDVEPVVVAEVLVEDGKPARRK